MPLCQIFQFAWSHLPADQHQFLDNTKIKISSKNWCWLFWSQKSWFIELTILLGSDAVWVVDGRRNRFWQISRSKFLAFNTWFACPKVTDRWCCYWIGFAQQLLPIVAFMYVVLYFHLNTYIHSEIPFWF